MEMQEYQTHVLEHCFHEDISVLPQPSDIYHLQNNLLHKDLTAQCQLTNFPKCECEKGSKCNNTKCTNVLCYYECGSNCAAISSCMNNRILTKKWKKCEIFLTETKGFGLQSKENIEKGEFAIKYVGEIRVTK